MDLLGGHKKLCGERREISQRVSIDAPCSPVFPPLLHQQRPSIFQLVPRNLPSWQPMSLSTMSNISNSKSSLCPTYVPIFTAYFFLIPFCSNGRQTVGDGALIFDNEPSVLAVCHLQGTDDMYYYSTTFSGGPGVCLSRCLYSPRLTCR